MWIYLGIALLDWATDAAICYATEREFKIVPALLAALFWPATCLFVVFGAAFLSKKKFRDG